MKQPVMNEIADFAGKGLDVTFVQVDVVDPTSVSRLVGKALELTRED